MPINISDHIISSTAIARTALQQLDYLSGHNSRVLFVLDTNLKLIGSVTDGDIRRGLLSGLEISQSVTCYMNNKFRYMYLNMVKQEEIKRFKQANIDLLPVLNLDGTIYKLLDLKLHETIIPVSAFIMAGGRGERLRPLTDSIPKPMLMVGSKPILEHNIDRLIRFGVEKFYISVRYKAEIIKEHFGDGSQKGVNIEYVEEKEPLGTAGAIALAKSIPHDEILLMNSDVLTTLDFASFYGHFVSNAAMISAASIPYTINIPYGVFELADDSNIFSIKEKPSYTYYSNAGIYLIQKSVLELIPKNKLYNATDLITDAIRNQLKVVSFPILGYWLDIGRQEDFIKAQIDIKHLDL